MYRPACGVRGSVSPGEGDPLGVTEEKPGVWGLLWMAYEGTFDLGSWTPLDGALCWMDDSFCGRGARAQRTTTSLLTFLMSVLVGAVCGVLAMGLRYLRLHGRSEMLHLRVSWLRGILSSSLCFFCVDLLCLFPPSSPCLSQAGVRVPGAVPNGIGESSGSNRV